MLFTVLANAVLITHVAFVAFVVLTVPCIIVGGLLGWRWVRNYWLRICHLVSIFIVVAQAWAGELCPLTTFEMWLRERAAGATYAGSFIEHWLHDLLYWAFPSWVFTLAYSLFALLIVLTWYLVPPVRKRKS